MTNAADQTSRIADALERRAIAVTSIEAATPDGRAWSIEPAAAGGFRLFEIDRDGGRQPEEHDAAEGDSWSAGDLADYLDAVGRPKNV